MIIRGKQKRVIIQHGQTELELLPEKAVFLPSSSSLILADVHLGKSATFRKSGIPVPEGDDVNDLERITALVKKKETAQLIIAGDLFHSPAGMNAVLKEQVERWLKELGIEVILVIGNHDRRSLRSPFSFHTTLSFQLENLDIIHDPADASDEAFSICGHIHPVIKLKQDRFTSRLPCFHLTSKILTLPSFGTLTGGKEILLSKEERFFLPHKDKVLEVPISMI